MQPDVLLERVLAAVADRRGYSVVAPDGRRDFETLDEAYSHWEAEMQGEVFRLDGWRYYYLDGTEAAL